MLLYNGSCSSQFKYWLHLRVDSRRTYCYNNFVIFNRKRKASLIDHGVTLGQMLNQFCGHYVSWLWHLVLERSRIGTEGVVPVSRRRFGLPWKAFRIDFENCLILIKIDSGFAFPITPLPFCFSLSFRFVPFGFVSLRCGWSVHHTRPVERRSNTDSSM